MNWIQQNWEKLVLVLVALLTLLGGVSFIRNALAFPDAFEQQAVEPGRDLPEPEGPTVTAAIQRVNEETLWTEQGAPLNRSKVIVEREGTTFDMEDPAEKPLHPPVTNQWLLEHELPYLKGNVLKLDSDQDGFSNEEEWNSQTSPSDGESHPLYANKLNFVARRQQSYIVEFMATSDGQKFQITRYPSQRHPRRGFFSLAIGETSEDGMLRVDGYEEKSASRNGITVDVSELKVTYLPTEEEIKLVRRVREVIPTYFAEFQYPFGNGEPIFVKLGDSFSLPNDPETKYKLIDIDEEKALVSPIDGPEAGKKITIKKD